MAYTNLNILKMDTGSNEGTWGTETNTNWDRVDSYISGYKEITLSGSASPLHTLDTTADATPTDATGDGWHSYVKFIGSPSGTGIIAIGPALKTKLYFIQNASGITLTFQYASGGTGTTLTTGYSTVICADGTNVIKAINSFETATVKADVIGSVTVGAGEAISVSSGGTITLNGSYPTGDDNIVIGESAGDALESSADENIYIGSDSGLVTTTGDNNTCVGHKTGRALPTSAGKNSFFGSWSGATSQGDQNVAIGYSCMGSGDSAGTGCDYNVGVGSLCLKELDTGFSNVAIGLESGQNVTSGDENTFIGTQTGGGNRSKCIALGLQAMKTDPGADEILIIDNEDFAAAVQPYSNFIYGDMANHTINFNQTAASAAHVKIQNTNTSSTSKYFLQCFNDSDDGSGGNEVFRVDTAGGVKNTSGTIGPLADYADMFEWSDGNPDAEDRIGLVVMIDQHSDVEGGVRPATSSDDPNDIIGVVSGTACVIGNAAWANWDKKYIKDDFGRTATHSVDEKTTPILNPEYDEGREYVPRMVRSEWGVIGLTGRIHIRKGSITHPSWRKIRDVSAVTEEWLVR